MKLKDLEVDSRNKIDLLIIGVEERITKTNRPYVVFQVTDGETTADVRRWDSTSEEFSYLKDTVVNMDIRTSVYNDTPSYDTDIILPTTLPVTDFVRKVPEDVEMMMSSIIQRVKQITEPSLKNMMVDILTDFREKLLYWSAAKNMHHNLYGGLLYHIYRMGKNADMQCDLYPMVNRDLLICGAYLHDIGKIIELDTSILGNAEYTMEGNLLGHHYLGMSIIEDYALRYKLPDSLKLQLLHMIASHHGKQEYGAIVVPKTIEAQMLHFLDVIDSKIYAFEDAINNMNKDQNTSMIKSINTTIYHF